jgi:hypothetical protein
MLDCRWSLSSQYRQMEESILPFTDDRSLFAVVTITGGSLWQKTGWNTFATTWVAIEYRNSTNPQPSTPLFRLDKMQVVGKTNKVWS